MLKRIALAALAVVALSGAGFARELNDLEWEGLEGVVLSHEAALHAKDAGAVIDVLPPAILPLIAQMSGGVTPEVARQQGIDIMMAQAEGVSFDAYDIDFENALGPYELADGTTYVLLPTTMIELPGDGSVLKDEVTVAVLIGGEWYLMGFDSEDEMQLLTAAYPAFGADDFRDNFVAALGSDAASSEVAAPDPVTLTAEQQAGLEERIASFDTAMRESDWAEVMSVVPGKVLEKFASDAGLTQDELLEQMGALMETALKDVTLESFGMSLDDASYAATADGTPYVLIPTETIVDMGAAGKIRAASATLAFMDEGQWYLVRTEDQMTMTTLKAIYPSFSDVEFPPGSMEPVTE